MADGDNGIQGKLLEQLEKYGALDSLVLSAGLDVNHQSIVGAIKSIQSLGSIIDVEPKSIKKWELTDEGKMVIINAITVKNNLIFIENYEITKKCGSYFLH